MAGKVEHWILMTNLVELLKGWGETHGFLVMWGIMYTGKDEISYVTTGGDGKLRKVTQGT